MAAHAYSPAALAAPCIQAHPPVTCHTHADSLPSASLLPPIVLCLYRRFKPRDGGVLPVGYPYEKAFDATVTVPKSRPISVGTRSILMTGNSHQKEGRTWAYLQARKKSCGKQLGHRRPGWGGSGRDSDVESRRPVARAGWRGSLDPLLSLAGLPVGVPRPARCLMRYDMATLEETRQMPCPGPQSIACTGFRAGTHLTLGLAHSHVHVPASLPWLPSLFSAGPEQKFNAAQTAATEMAWGLTSAPKAAASPFGRTRVVADTFWNKNSNQCAQ